MLDDALLDTVESRVVSVENPTRRRDVAGLLAVDAPRNVEQGVKVGADRGALRTLRADL